MNKELKEICSKCEDYIYCQGKGCAWRSLGNEYCDEIENVNKLINDLQQENQQLKIQVSSREEVANKYKEVIDEVIKYLKSIEKEPDADMYMMLGEYKEYKYLLQILGKGESNE